MCSVNCQLSNQLIASLVQVINWGVLGPPGDLGLGYAANLSLFSSCGNFNEANTVF